MHFQVKITFEKHYASQYKSHTKIVFKIKEIV
jgi:hypothetical protein